MDQNDVPKTLTWGETADDHRLIINVCMQDGQPIEQFILERAEEEKLGDYIQQHRARRLVTPSRLRVRPHEVIH